MATSRLTLLLLLLVLAQILVARGKAISDDIAIEGRDHWLKVAQDELMQRLEIKNNENVAKNIILFIGDGMGLSTLTMSRIYKGQLKGRLGEDEQLEWETWPAVGLSKTYNANYQVSGSASTATALFSGVKTRLGVNGVDSSLPRKTCDAKALEDAKLQNILDWAVESGKEAGLVTTTRITHATPASLYAHSADRNWETDSYKDEVYPNPDCNEDIAKQLIESERAQALKVVFGGGRRNFLKPEQGGNRLSDDLIQKAAQMRHEKGHDFKQLNNANDLEQWTSGNMSDYVLGLFSSSHMKYMTDRAESGEEEPTLSQMTAAALQRLQRSEKGFLLVVEGGRIDQAHHDNWAHKAMEETLELDRTVQETLKNVDLNNTLVVVTADHSHSVTINGYPRRGTPILGSDFQDPLTMSPYPNGVKQAYATISYANGLGYFDHVSDDITVPWKDFRTFDKTQFDNPSFRHPAMMPPPEEAETHGGEDVGIYAIGPMAHLLVGVHEQNYIPHVMAFSSCIGAFKDNCKRPSQ